MPRGYRCRLFFCAKIGTAGGTLLALRTTEYPLLDWQRKGGGIVAALLQVIVSNNYHLMV